MAEGAGHSDFQSARRVFRDGWLAVAVFRNPVGDKVYHDVVIYRRIVRTDGRTEWRRGANLKPQDLRQLVGLLTAAEEFLKNF